MGKQVPLVMYKGGVRTVLGMASVQDDGSITAQVTKDHWPLVKDLFLPNIGEFSISPFRKMTIVNETSTPGDNDATR
jgi:hypothetical protein